MNAQIVAENLVRLRKSKNWTQEYLSEVLHISRQAISKWETGISVPNLEALLELSKLYKISINEILEPPKLKSIAEFEELNHIDSSTLRIILSSFPISEIVKASMGASPLTNKLLKCLFEDIDFEHERHIIGSVRITEIENIHNRIVDEVNNRLSNIS